MKYVALIVLALLILMSVAAGGAKVAHMPQEIQFFADAGLSKTWLVPVGILQIIGGLLAIFPRSRSAGAAVIAAGFLITTIVIFITGNIGFGLFSLLPVLIAVFFMRRSRTISE